MNTKLSIITINLNNIEGLRITIRSIIQQTFPDFEWIVIDGGSTDGSKELIQQNEDKITYWVSEPDKGIFNAMNKGILHAKGEYLQFINSGDSLFQAETLEKVFSLNLSSDIWYGNILMTKNNRSIGIYEYPSPLTLSFVLDRAINHQASFIKRDIFNNRLYNESNRIVSDWEMSYQLICENKKFEHIPFVVAVYDVTGIGTTGGEALISERENSMKEYLPSPIHLDYLEFKKLRMRIVEIDLYSMITEIIEMNRFSRNIVRGGLIFFIFLHKVISKGINITRSR